jgi:hypothetical protein
MDCKDRKETLEPMDCKDRKEIPVPLETLDRKDRKETMVTLAPLDRKDRKETLESLDQLGRKDHWDRQELEVLVSQTLFFATVRRLALKAIPFVLKAIPFVLKAFLARLVRFLLEAVLMEMRIRGLFIGLCMTIIPAPRTHTARSGTIPTSVSNWGFRVYAICAQNFP